MQISNANHQRRAASVRGVHRDGASARVGPRLRRGQPSGRPPLASPLRRTSGNSASFVRLSALQSSASLPRRKRSTSAIGCGRAAPPSRRRLPTRHRRLPRLTKIAPRARLPTPCPARAFSRHQPLELRTSAEYPELAGDGPGPMLCARAIPLSPASVAATAHARRVALDAAPGGPQP